MSRTRFVFALAAVFSTVFAARNAAADDEPMGQRGQFVVEGNRLFTLLGYESFKTSNTTGNVTTSTTNSQVTFGITGTGAGTVFSIPRMGADFFVIDHLTVGGDLLFWTTLSKSTDDTIGGTTRSTNNPKQTLFGLAPRAGWYFGFNDNIGFWPRAGFSFFEAWVGGSDNSTTQWAIDVEPLFVLSPARHFAFSAGPVVGIPLTGSASTTLRNGPVQTTVSNDTTQFYVGLTAGLLGWF
jgi:hypothetical protein